MVKILFCKKLLEFINSRLCQALYASVVRMLIVVFTSLERAHPIVQIINLVISISTLVTFQRIVKQAVASGSQIDVLRLGLSGDDSVPHEEVYEHQCTVVLELSG